MIRDERRDEETIRFQQGKARAHFSQQAEPIGKVRITIRIDEDVGDYFLKEADASGGAVGYQALINDALRLHVENKAPKLEDTLRRIFREEIRAAS